MRISNTSAPWIGIVIPPVLMLVCLALATTARTAYLYNEFIVVGTLVLASIAGAVAIFFFRKINVWARIAGSLAYLAVTLFASVVVLGVTGILSA